MKAIVLLAIGIVLGASLTVGPSLSAQDSALPPLFTVGQRVCTIQGLTQGDTYRVEAVLGAWIQVRGRDGATFPYWLKPESLPVGFMECRP